MTVPWKTKQVDISDRKGFAQTRPFRKELVLPVSDIAPEEEVHSVRRGGILLCMCALERFSDVSVSTFPPLRPQALCVHPNRPGFLAQFVSAGQNGPVFHGI